MYINAIKYVLNHKCRLKCKLLDGSCYMDFS